MSPTKWEKIELSRYCYRLKRVEIITHPDGKNTECLSFSHPHRNKEPVHPIRVTSLIWKPPRTTGFIFTT